MNNTILGLVMLSFVSYTQASTPTTSKVVSDYQGSGTITQGRAKTINKELYNCESGRSRVSAVGEIVDTNGEVWTVPASNQYLSAAHAVDLYNECTGNTPRTLSDIDLSRVPVVEIDPDGDIVTGYIFADNYFELYVNGKLIGVDAVPFTPFNSSVVKYKVKKPYQISVKLIDWEENLGLGSENNRGKSFHPGDGGFIASFSDGTVTSGEWSAQVFYTSPIYDLTCLEEQEEYRDTSSCFADGTNDGEQAYAVHWPLPEHWESESYDFSTWPKATTYSEEVIGVNNKKAYMNFREKFAGAKAEFIWSGNVVLDNHVLLKYEVK